MLWSRWGAALARALSGRRRVTRGLAALALRRCDTCALMPGLDALRQERHQIHDLGGLCRARRLFRFWHGVHVTRLGTLVDQRQQVFAVVVSVALGLPLIHHAGDELFRHFKLFAGDAELLQVLLGQPESAGPAELVGKAENEQ